MSLVQLTVQLDVSYLQQKNLEASGNDPEARNLATILHIILRSEAKELVGFRVCGRALPLKLLQRVTKTWREVLQLDEYLRTHYPVAMLHINRPEAFTAVEPKPAASRGIKKVLKGLVGRDHMVPDVASTEYAFDPLSPHTQTILDRIAQYFQSLLMCALLTLIHRPIQTVNF